MRGEETGEALSLQDAVNLPKHLAILVGEGARGSVGHAYNLITLKGIPWKEIAEHGCSPKPRICIRRRLRDAPRPGLFALRRGLPNGGRGV